MKAEIKINTDELVSEITQKVTNAIIPTLKKGMGMGMGDTVFTVETLAKYLQVKKQWVYARIHSKKIPHIKMGKFPRFKKS